MIRQELIEKIQMFAQKDWVKRFNESAKVKASISRSPFSVLELEKLIARLKQHGASDFEFDWALKEHALWATTAFPHEEATQLFASLVHDATLIAKTKAVLRDTRVPIQIAINFNGTNNKSHTKHNGNDQVIESNEYDFTLNIPGVGSSALLSSDPVGLAKSEIEKCKNTENHPFKDLFNVMNPKGSSGLLRPLFRAFPGIAQKIRVRDGNGVFYAAIYAAIKIYDIQQQYPNTPLNLNVFGHSRGSVSALLCNFILKQLMDMGALHEVRVVQSLNDPVPGGDLSKPQNYKNYLKDDSFPYVKKLFPSLALQGINLVDALMHSTQPALVTQSFITYPVGDTRDMFSPLGHIVFDESTESHSILSPGCHNDPIYGRYPLGILSFGLTEKTKYIAKNMSGIADKHQRENIAIFYTNLSGLFIQYSRSAVRNGFAAWLVDNNEASKWLETYAKLMVEGYAVHIMTDSYAVLQTNRARHPDTLVRALLPHYFMDSLHEDIFKKYCPLLFELLRTNPTREMIRTHSEFAALPLSMKRVLMSEQKGNGAFVDKTSKKKIDAIIPISYLLGSKARSRQLLTRQPYAEAMPRIPLGTERAHAI